MALKTAYQVRAARCVPFLAQKLPTHALRLTQGYDPDEVKRK